MHSESFFVRNMSEINCTSEQILYTQIQLSLRNFIMRTLIFSGIFLIFLSSCTKNTDTLNSSPKLPQTVTATVVDVPSSTSQVSDSGAMPVSSAQ